MFKKSKYTNIYYNIINKAKRQHRYKSDKTYYESHHIVPKALNGSNDKENIVLLTAKEHFICHLLLPKMCINSNHKHKMICALNSMLRSSNTQKRYSSKLYEQIKIQHAKSMSILLKNRKKPKDFGEKIRLLRTGIPHSEERKKKISLNHHDVSGPNNPMFNKKHNIDTKNKISKANKGKLSGDKNPMFGKTHTDETKMKLSEHGKNKWTPELKAKMIETRKINKMKKLNNEILFS
jgi:hypothetical protein